MRIINGHFKFVLLLVILMFLRNFFSACVLGDFCHMSHVLFIDFYLIQTNLEYPNMLGDMQIVRLNEGSDT